MASKSDVTDLAILLFGVVIPALLILAALFLFAGP